MLSLLNLIEINDEYPWYISEISITKGEYILFNNIKLKELSQ